MNYYEELISSFEEWLKLNDLSITAQLLWYKLVFLFYKNNWNSFSISNFKLMIMTKINAQQTLFKSRNELIENNLIEFKKGNGRNNLNQYKILTINFNNLKENFNEEKSNEEMDS